MVNIFILLLCEVCVVSMCLFILTDIFLGFYIPVVVQSLSRVQLFVTPWTAARQPSLSFTISQFLQTHAHWVNNAIQSTYLLWPSSPAFNPPPIQGFFQWVGSSLQVTKHWSFSFSINPSNEYSRLISFRIDWFELLAVQGTLTSLIQNYN